MTDLPPRKCKECRNLFAPQPGAMRRCVGCRDEARRLVLMRRATTNPHPDAAREAIHRARVSRIPRR